MESPDSILQTIFDQAAVGIAQGSVDGVLLRANNRYCQMLGYSATELRTKRIQDITHPEDLAETLVGHRQLLEGQISMHSMEKRYIRRDGTIFWGRLSRSLVRDHDNRPKYFIAALEDITEKIQAERALRDKERQLVLAQSAGRLGLWERDLRTGVTVTSPEFARLHGLTPDQLPVDHEGYLQLVHPEDRLRVQTEYQESLERTHLWDTEFRVTWPDGSVHWLLGKGQVFLDDAGRSVRLAGVSFDITERKRAETALRESELLNKQVLDNIPECIFVFDVTPDRRFKFVGLNPAEEKAVGLSNSEVRGRFVEDVLPEEVACKVSARYRQCLDAGTLISYEEELQMPIGLRYFRTNLIPIKDAEGMIYRIVGCCSDLTETRRTQEKASDRQKLESIGVLAGGIAHDFNNLLGGILTETELVEAHVAAGLSPNEEIARIKAVAIHGAEIVRELMIYAGQDQQGGGEPVNLSRLTAEMLELMKVSISKHAILKIDLGKSLPLIWGNASQIRQVLMNLVINASEAIGDTQGVIQVSTSLAPGNHDAASNYVAKVSEGERVRLEVSDSGCGMTEETKGKIFDPFFTTKFAGRGLGLAVVQGIVRAHGGSIDVVSTLDHGTTFQVSLPAASKDQLGALNAITPSTAGRIHTPTAPCATVLVVEDEEVLRLAVSKALRMRGFAVIEAKDGSVAMDLMRKHRDGIDIILLDVTLPGTSSREVFEEAQRLRTNLKIVLSSAYDRGSVDAYFAGLRITQFIRKPFQLHDLEVTLRDALAG
jgi:two-component system, cell cycle sensor histidine kinase and response regulator CckA